MNKNEITKFPNVTNQELLEIFEEWISFISQHYSRKNTIQPYDLIDLEQFVRTRLIEQLPKIKTNFKGGSKIRTYMSSIILNLCREFRRKHCGKSILTQTEITDWNHLHHHRSNSAVEDMAIEHEIQKLKRIITMFGAKSPKIKLTLKSIYRLPVSEKDLFSYCQNSEIKSLNAYSKLNGKQENNKKEIIQLLTELFNLVENKENSTEATRKWVARLINEILDTLNSDQSNHSKETLGYLLERSESR